MQNKKMLLLILTVAIVVAGVWWLLNIDRTVSQSPIDRNTPSQPTVVPGDDGWSTFTDNSLGFSIKYPSNWFYSKTDSVVMITPLSPDDPKRSSDIGAISSLIVKRNDAKELESSRELSTQEKEVMIGNTTAILLTVLDVFTGGTRSSYFIPVTESNYINAVFHDSLNPDKYPFEEILKTISVIN